MLGDPCFCWLNKITAYSENDIAEDEYCGRSMDYRTSKMQNASLAPPTIQYLNQNCQSTQPKALLDEEFHGIWWVCFFLNIDFQGMGQ